MKLAQHHIRKQFLDFDFRSKSEALQWQQKVSFQYQQEYAKTISAVLDRYDDGTYIEIDKITIDIGTVKEESIAQRLGEELDKVIKKIVQKEIKTSKPRNSKSNAKSTSVESNTIVAKSTRKELLHVFTYFISQGHFPWHKTMQSIPRLEEQLLEQFSISDLVGALRTDKMLDQHWQKARLFHQFSDAFVQEIVALYYEDEVQHLNQITEYCEVQFMEPFFIKLFKKSTKAEITKYMIEWILLYTSKDRTSWPKEFTQWYITKNCISEVLNSNKGVWNFLKAGILKESSQRTVEVLKKVFSYLKAKEELQNSRLDSSQQIDNNMSAKSETQENSDHHHAQEDTNKAKSNNLNGVQDPKESDADEKYGEEVAKIPELDPESTVSENLKAKAILDELSNSEDLEKVPPIINQKEKNTAIPKDQAENDEHLSNLDAEVTNPGESVDISSPEIPLKDLDSELIFDQTGQQKEFYTRVEETIDALIPPEKDFRKPEQNASTLPVDNYYINDSGIVLTWPYLSRLFENLKYTSENQFVSKQQQERAVLLLGYIAAGKPSCGEHELVFSKFLCNWPFRMPVIARFEPTNEEQEEVKSMLNGLISHWSILKNTSIEGLRETFFWREGKLEEKEEHWKLVIEQKGTDILLDHLPYGISMIKLPWHKKMLKVDWA